MYKDSDDWRNSFSQPLEFCCNCAIWALRQNDFDHMKLEGQLHRLSWED